MPKFKKKPINRLPNLFQGVLSFYLYGIQDKNELVPIHESILGTMHKKFRRLIRLRRVNQDEIDFVFHRASAEIAENGHLWMETYY